MRSPFNTEKILFFNREKPHEIRRLYRITLLILERVRKKIYFWKKKEKIENFIILMNKTLLKRRSYI